MNQYQLRQINYYLKKEKTDGEIGLLMPSVRLKDIRKIRKKFEADTNLKRGDVLVKVLNLGKISIEDLRAANYIRCGWWVLNNYNERFNYDTASFDPEIISSNYLYWIKKCENKYYNTGCLLNIIIHNFTFSQTERAFKLRNGIVIKKIKSALKLYNNLFETDKIIKNETFRTETIS